MIHFLSALCLFFQVYAGSNEISGEVALSSGTALKTGGILFVIAKNPGSPMPVAVLRVPNPKFPFKFTLRAENAMVPGTPFTGPFLINARYSPTGNAMDKSGPEGVEPKPVAVGRTDVKIELKAN